MLWCEVRSPPMFGMCAQASMCPRVLSDGAVWGSCGHGVGGRLSCPSSLIPLSCHLLFVLFLLHLLFDFVLCCWCCHCQLFLFIVVLTIVVLLLHHYVLVLVLHYCLFRLSSLFSSVSFSVLQCSRDCLNTVIWGKGSFLSKIFFSFREVPSLNVFHFLALQVGPSSVQFHSLQNQWKKLLFSLGRKSLCCWDFWSDEPHFLFISCE